MHQKHAVILTGRNMQVHVDETRNLTIANTPCSASYNIRSD